MRLTDLQHMTGTAQRMRQYMGGRQQGLACVDPAVLVQALPGLLLVLVVPLEHRRPPHAHLRPPRPPASLQRTAPHRSITTCAPRRRGGAGGQRPERSRERWGRVGATTTSPRG